MALKEMKVIEVTVGSHTAIVENGEVARVTPAPLKTEAEIKTYIQFLQEVLEAVDKTKPVRERAKK